MEFQLDQTNTAWVTAQCRLHIIVISTGSSSNHNMSYPGLVCGTVVRVLVLQLEMAGSIPAAKLSNATFGKLFIHTASVTKDKLDTSIRCRVNRNTLWF